MALSDDGFIAALGDSSGEREMALWIRWALARECGIPVQELLPTLLLYELGYTHLAQLASQMRSVKESHHFSPVLVYFRFNEQYYTVSRLTTVMLDAVTLIKSGLDDDEFASLKESAAVNGMWRAAMRLLTSVDDAQLPHPRHEPGTGPDAATLDRWRRRYGAGLRRLRESGLQTIRDERKGFEVYASLRVQWDRKVASLAAFMAVDARSADPVGTDPQSTADRPDFAAARLHSAG